jgi:hypothetical protein
MVDECPPDPSPPDPNPPDPSPQARDIPIPLIHALKLIGVALCVLFAEAVLITLVGIVWKGIAAYLLWLADGNAEKAEGTFFFRFVSVCGQIGLGLLLAVHLILLLMYCREELIKEWREHKKRLAR